MTHKLFTAYGAPGLVKRASREDTDTTAFPDTAFASEKRAFPVMTADDTWVSCMFYANNFEKLEKYAAVRIGSNLLQASKLWHIEQDVLAMWRKSADARDAASRDATAYAMEFTQDGTTVKSFPISGVDHIVKSAAEFIKVRPTLNLELRQKLANNLVKAALSHNAFDDLPEQVLRSSGDGYVISEMVADGWLKRANLMAERQNTPAANLARNASKQFRACRIDNPTPDDFQKIAKAFDDFDTTHRITHLYAQGLPLPEDSTYCETYIGLAKKASQHIKLTNGATYEIAAMGKLTLEKLAEVLGDEFASDMTCPLTGKFDIEKAASVFPTLPRPEAALIDQLLEQVSASSVFREKQAFSVR